MKLLLTSQNLYNYYAIPVPSREYVKSLSSDKAEIIKKNLA